MNIDWLIVLSLWTLMRLKTRSNFWCDTASAWKLQFFLFMNCTDDSYYWKLITWFDSVTRSCCLGNLSHFMYSYKLIYILRFWVWFSDFLLLILFLFLFFPQSMWCVSACLISCWFKWSWDSDHMMSCDHCNQLMSVKLDFQSSELLLSRALYTSNWFNNVA